VAIQKAPGKLGKIQITDEGDYIQENEVGSLVCSLSFFVAYVQ
jgi:hypothetical protein